MDDDDGDPHDRDHDDEPRAHLGRTAEVVEGYVEGVAVRALCGRTFVPWRDADQLPDCEQCHDIFRLMAAVAEWTDQWRDRP